MVSQLAFVAPPSLQPRLIDLAEALAAEVRDLGLDATVEREAIPPRQPGRVAVLLDPPRLAIGRRGRPPGRRQLAGGLAVWAGLAPGVAAPDGPAFDLDLESARARSGARDANPLPIGWVEGWAAPLDGDREIDLAIIGAGDERSGRLLAAAADQLSRWRVQIAATADPLAPDGGPGGYETAAERRGVLARSRVVIDLEREGPPYLDALRASEAICAGAALVRESRRPLAAFEPGAHYADGAGGPVAAAIALLADPGHLEELTAGAAAAAREAPLRAAAEALAEAAARLPSAGPRRAVVLAGAPDTRLTAPPPVSTDPDAASARRRLKRARLGEIDLARELERLAVRLDGGDGEPRVELASTAADRAAPRVSVLVTVFDYEAEIGGALDSVAGSRFDDLELVIVDDASRDGSRERAADWVRSHPQVAAKLVSHAANRGLPSARNTALAHARGELAFILDADNRVLPHGLGRLVEALDADPGASFAYGLAKRVDERGTSAGADERRRLEPGAAALRELHRRDGDDPDRAAARARRLHHRARPLRLGGLRPLVPDGRGRVARRSRARDPGRLSRVLRRDGVVDIQHLDHRRLPATDRPGAEVDGRGRAPGLDSRR